MQTSPSIIRRPRDFGSHSINSPTTVLRRNRTHERKPFSKTAAISIILLHVFLTGMMAGTMDYSATAAIFSNISKGGHGSILLKYIAHSITLLALFVYPLLGFLADVYFGRYWMVVVSVLVMALATLVSSVAVPLYQEFWEMGQHLHLIKALFVISYCLAGLGIAGFEANVIQFGLDQLMESSSRSLSLYLHLLVWVRQAGVALVIIPFTLVDCDYKTSQAGFKGTFQFAPLVLLIALVAVPLVTLVRLRKGFYRELGDMNPYKMVFKVLYYVMKNPRPQRRRSAFFYYYGLKPGRMDFAKVHYGGPFETEEVENVKTVLQILGVIICVGPVFILRVSTSYFIYQHFVDHFVTQEFIEEHCTVFWPLVGSGNQMNIIGTVLFPIYIFVVFKVLKNIPRILLRLLIGLVMVTICLGCFLLIELAGHWTREAHNNGTALQCALMKLDNSTATATGSLDVHWASLIPPTFITGLATEVIFSAVFEFISAQSPKSMTGLLIGTFFFVMGFFQLLGLALIAPFTERKFWEPKVVQNFTLAIDDSMDYLLFELEREEALKTQEIPHWVSTACEMWYLSVIVILGVLGTILFSVAARKYQYRKREENPFPQSDIEDIVTRGIEQESTQNLLDVASVEAQRDGYGSGSGRGLCPATVQTTTAVVHHGT